MDWGGITPMFRFRVGYRNLFSLSPHPHAHLSHHLPLLDHCVYLVLNVLTYIALHFVSPLHSRRFLLQTTAHGVHKLQFLWKKGHRCRFIFWLVVVLAAFTYLGFALVERISFFSSHPSTSSATVVTLNPFPFPAVTVCNANGYVRSRVLASSGEDLTNDELLELSYDVDELLLGCEFAGQECELDEMKAFQHPQFGTCYTFNAGEVTLDDDEKYHWKQSKGRTYLASNLTGPSEGLRLFIDIQQEEYIPFQFENLQIPDLPDEGEGSGGGGGSPSPAPSPSSSSSPSSASSSPSASSSSTPSSVPSSSSSPSSASTPSTTPSTSSSSSPGASPSQTPSPSATPSTSLSATPSTSLSNSPSPTPSRSPPAASASPSASKSPPPNPPIVDTSGSRRRLGSGEGCGGGGGGEGLFGGGLDGGGSDNLGSREDILATSEQVSSSTPSSSSSTTSSSSSSRGRVLGAGGGGGTVRRPNNATFGPMTTGPESAGIYVMVHDPREPPGIADAVAIPPGNAADVHIRPKLIQRLPPPYGECHKPWYNATRADPNLDPWPQSGAPVGYSKARCEFRCYVKRIAERCNCYILPWPEDETPFPMMQLGPLPNDSMPLCGTDEKKCLRNTKLLFSSGLLGCSDQCPAKCLEWEHAATTSFQTFPAQASQHVILQAVQGLKGNGTIDKDYVSRNIISLRVYAPRFEVLQVQAAPSYEVGDLLGDLGGQSGLFAGISAVSILEVLELLVLLSSTACTTVLCCSLPSACCGNEPRSRRKPKTPTPGSSYRTKVTKDFPSSVRDDSPQEVA